jgi:hypothetical protein
MTPLFAGLVLAAASVGALHSLAPDHWVPFAALARAGRWSARRTAMVTLSCGIGHVTVSVLLGLCGLLLGFEILVVFGRRMEAAAGILLIGFGLAYAIWGLRRALHGRVHDHLHAQGAGELAQLHFHARDGKPRPLTGWSLFALFSADPCVAVLPILFAAAPLGGSRAAAVVVTYEAATLSAMLLLVLLARAGASRLRARWFDRYGDGAAGLVIAAAGVVTAVLGM